VPTYQYACTEPECGHAFEQFQSFSDEALTVCPQCEGRLRKVFNAVGVVFKGSGFYRTDSRAAATSGEGAAGDSGSTSGDTSGGTSTKESGDSSTKGSPASTSSPAPASTPSTSSSAPAGAGAA
jgi:putative FmdB family regulatory protein